MTNAPVSLVRADQLREPSTLDPQPALQPKPTPVLPPNDAVLFADPCQVLGEQRAVHKNLRSLFALLADYGW